MEKTKIEDFIRIMADCPDSEFRPSVRLFNSLWEYVHCIKYKEYIEDIDSFELSKVDNCGEKTIDEFIKVKNYFIEKKKKDAIQNQPIKVISEEMSRRDWFAAMAMQALIPIFYASTDNKNKAADCAKHSIIIADEIMKKINANNNES